jgi:2-iminobutanoate/2-iminopropanoate deaminase
VKKTVIYSEKAPAAVGPYSQAIRSENVLFTSGQIPLEPDSGKIVDGGIQGQTRQVMENLRSVLAAGGAGFSNVVKTTCFLKQMDDFAQFNEIYQDYFKDSPPARSCVEVNRLPKDVLVEIEVIAVI